MFHLQAGKDRSRSLVKAMDRYGLAVAATLHGSTKLIVARTKNLLMRIDHVKKDSPYDNNVRFASLGRIYLKA